MNSKKQKKTIVGLLVSIIALLMFTIGMTFAYFTASSSATSSSMSFGTLAVSFYNDEIGVSIESDALHNKVIPGCTLDVTGKIVTTSTISSLLRIKPSVEVTPAQGSELVKATAENTLLGILITSFETDDGNWLRANGTGSYLYYAGKVVPNGQVTFSNVVMELPANVFGNDWQGATFTVTIEVEAIQAEHVQYNNSGTLTGVNFTYDEDDNTKQDIVNQIAGIVTSTSAETTIWGVEFPTVEILPAPTQAQLNGIKYLDFGITNILDEDGDLSNSFDLELISDDIQNNDYIELMQSINERYVFVMFKQENDGNKVIENADKTNGKFAIEIPEYVKLVNGDVQLATAEEYATCVADDDDFSVFKVFYIKTCAFDCIVGLNTIIIPEAIDGLSQYAISDCPDLEEVYFNAIHAEYFRDFAWYDWDSLIYCYEDDSEEEDYTLNIYYGENVEFGVFRLCGTGYRNGNINLFFNSGATSALVKEEFGQDLSDAVGEALGGATYIYFANGITGTGANSIYTYVTTSESFTGANEAPVVSGYTAYKRN